MKLQLPWLGKATGSSAGLIIQSYWNRTFGRSFPALFHYPDTPEQQEAQAKFYDIQRIWVPIYNELRTNFPKYQVRNKNPFNLFSKNIYKILDPYKPIYQINFAKNFGLDPLNRVRAVVQDVQRVITPETISLRIIQGRPYIYLNYTFDTMHLLLLNKERQDIIYTKLPWTGDLPWIELENTNEWKYGNTLILCYALSCAEWFGNFQTRIIVETK